MLFAADLAIVLRGHLEEFVAAVGGEVACSGLADLSASSAPSTVGSHPRSSGSDPERSSESMPLIVVATGRLIA